MVESPYYLVSKGRNEEAAKILRWLQDKETDEDMSLELEVVKKYVDEQRSIDVNDFMAIFLPGNVKLIGSIMAIGLPGTFSCTCIIYAYGPVIIQDLEPYVNGGVFILVLGALRTMCDVFSPIVVTKFKRYTLMFYGQIATGAIQLASSVCFYLNRQQNVELGLVPSLLHTRSLLCYWRSC